MSLKPIIEEKKIENAIGNIQGDAFTILDFIEAFRSMYPEEWSSLVRRFGLFGAKRRYTVLTYFSNRLDVYSQKPHSILTPFTRYKEDKFKDHRRTTEKEKQVFGSPWIAVFRKKINKQEGSTNARHKSHKLVLY